MTTVVYISFTDKPPIIVLSSVRQLMYKMTNGSCTVVTCKVWSGTCGAVWSGTEHLMIQWQKNGGVHSVLHFFLLFTFFLLRGSSWYAPSLNARYEQNRRPNVVTICGPNIFHGPGPLASLNLRIPHGFLTRIFFLKKIFIIAALTVVLVHPR